jgi:3'(2'), 5'-bisphosphate nucleotidase
MDQDFQQYMPDCLALARRTGVILLNYWRQPQPLPTQKKADGTFATAADFAAHQEITRGLQTLTPDIPVLSEEGTWPDYPERAQWPAHWLVDPLDGTRGFIAHLEQFSINIALIVNHLPVLGIIYVPAAATAYYAWQGGGTYTQVGDNAGQRIRPPGRNIDAPWRIVIGQYSRGKRLSQLIDNQYEFEVLHVNGSIKFGWLAEGQADVYPRLAPICEWDTAAGQCILTECGGAVVDLQGRTLQYNRKASLLNPDFIALADSSWTERWLKVLSRK